MSDIAKRSLRTRIARSVEAIHRSFVDNLPNSAPFQVCADFQDYVDCQARVGEAYQDQDQWTRMFILNMAHCGKFSSDRAIREYNTDMWHVPPLRVAISKT